MTKPSFLGRKEAHGFGDVQRSPHTTGRHRGQVGISDGRDFCVTLYGHEARRDQHVDRSPVIGHRSDELGNMSLVGDVSCKGGSIPALVPDRLDHSQRLHVVAHTVDRNSQAILRQPPRNSGAEPARAACHYCDPLSHRGHPNDHRTGLRNRLPTVASHDTRDVRNGSAHGLDL